MTGHANSERSAKAARIRREVDASLDLLAESLDRGTSEEMNRFLAAMARFHSYSFQNLLLILSQRPDATRVAGFHTWRTLGRTVNKGEQGIAIFAPMRIKQKKEPGSQTPSPAKADDENESFLRFRVVHVFDVSQTDGEPLPEPTRVGGDPAGALAILKGVIADRGIELVEDADLGGADGVSTGGCIKIRGGLAPAAAFSVLVHELAHEMLHKVDADKRPPKTVRETEAEAVAHVVCDSIGLDVGSAASDYIGLYKGERDTLSASLTRIQRTACEIIEAVNAGLDRERAAERQPESEPASDSISDMQRLEPETFIGDISKVDASYSGDRIGMHGRVRTPFRWKGSDWVSVGQGPGGVFEVYELKDPDDFEGEITTYTEKTRDSASARDDPDGFYHGMRVRYGQRIWVLCGPPVQLVAAKSLLPKQESQKPIRVGLQMGLFDRGRDR